MKNEIAFPKNMNFTVGLTKRELFAAMAMQGVAAGLHSTVGSHNRSGGSQFDPVDGAKMSVMYADALIAELERKEE